MIEADAKRFKARYASVLKSAFLKHGILSLESANAVVEFPAGAPEVRARALAGGFGDDHLPLMQLPGRRYGLGQDLLVPALVETKRFSVSGSEPDVGGVRSSSHDQAARSFVEDLFRRDKVEVGDDVEPEVAAHLSHAVRRVPEGLVLVRTSVDCGFDVLR